MYCSPAGSRKSFRVAGKRAPVMAGIRPSPMPQVYRHDGLHKMPARSDSDFVWVHQLYTY